MRESGEHEVRVGCCRRGDPPMATSLVDPAASTTTHASSMPMRVPLAACDDEFIGDTLAPPIVTEEVRHTTTAIGPEPSVDLNNTVPILPTDEGETRKENQVVAAATQVVNITMGDKFVGAIYTSASAGISMSPLVHASSAKVQKALDALHGASPDRIAMTHVTYSTDCVNQVRATSSLALPITPTSPFWNHDLDVSSLTRHQGLLIRPTPWPSFALSHEGMILEHERLLPQVTYEVKYLSGDMNSLTASSSQQIMQLMGNVNLSAAEWMMSVSAEIQGYDLPGAGREPQPKPRPLFEFSQETIQLKPLWPSFSCYCQPVQVLRMLVHWILLLRLPAGERTSEVCNTTSNIGLQLIPFEQLLCTPPASITEQGQLNYEGYPWHYVVFGLLYELVSCSEANGVLKIFSSADLRASSRYLLSVHLKPCSSEKVVCWIHPVARAIFVIMRLRDVQLKWCSELPNGELPDDHCASVTICVCLQLLLSMTLVHWSLLSINLLLFIST